MIQSTKIKQTNGRVIQIHPVITPSRVGITWEVDDDEGLSVFHEMWLDDVHGVMKATLELAAMLSEIELVPESNANVPTMLDDLINRKKGGEA